MSAKKTIAGVLFWGIAIFCLGAIVVEFAIGVERIINNDFHILGFWIAVAFGTTVLVLITAAGGYEYLKRHVVDTIPISITIISGMVWFFFLPSLMIVPSADDPTEFGQPIVKECTEWKVVEEGNIDIIKYRIPEGE